VQSERPAKPSPDRAKSTLKDMPYRFETRQWVPYPVELVFAFFANPSNLPHLMPPILQTRIEEIHLQPPPPRPLAEAPERRFQSVAAGQGTELHISFQPLAWIPRRLSWTARITEFEWNSHFCDEQVSGPFRQFRHRHGIQAETQDWVEGTLVSDEVEFTLPFGLIGSLGGFLVRRQLAKSFAYRQKRLPEILAAASRQATRRS